MQARFIGEYRVVATLGRGGMAEVFLAVRSGLVGFTKLVVIKRLRPDLASVPEAGAFRTLLLDEARLGARLQHPNIVQTYEVGSFEGEPYMAMEYLEGRPLSSVLVAARSQSVKMTTPMKLEIVADVLAALDYAHDLRDFDGSPLGIVHRDVSPHNVFWTYDGEIKLVDFGVAKSRYGTDETAAGVVKGKVTYMAPEQARSEKVDRRADVFSVGVVLWEMLASRRLFRTDSQTASLEMLLTGSIPRIETAVPDIDPAIATIVGRALERDPARRYATAGEMRRDIDAVLETSRAVRRDERASFIRALFEKERRELQTRVSDAMASQGTETPDLTIATAPSSLSSLRQGTPVTLQGAANTQPPPKPRRRGRLVALAVACAATLAASALVVWKLHHAVPSAASASPSASAPVAPTEADLRLCGSNTVGAELAPALVEAFLARKGAASVHRLVHGDALTVIADMTTSQLAVSLSAKGTATAFEGLAAGTCDIGMASRPVNDKEASKLSSLGMGDMRSPGAEHVIALDGIAVIVHPDNKVRSLDRQTLHDVFTGGVTDWSSIGGAPGPIAIWSRDDKSGTYDTFKHLVLGNDALVASAKRVEGSDTLSDAVASNPAAIGFVGLAYVRSAKAVAVGERGAQPMLPTSFTVTTESYMLSRRLFFYSTAKPRTPLVTELVSFALSAEGQAVVRTTSFVDLTITLRDGGACDAACPRRYAMLTAHAQRMSLDFRFKLGTSDLDSRATRDLDRIVQFMRSHPDGQLALLGFSDALGDSMSNTRLSLARAQAVSRELTMRGVRVATVDGFGAAMPVASNATEADRDRNRRVEVWLQTR